MVTESSVNGADELLAFKSALRAWRPSQPEAIQKIDDCIRHNRGGHGRPIGGRILACWLKEKFGVIVHRGTVSRYMQIRAKEIE